LEPEVDTVFNLIKKNDDEISIDFLNELCTQIEKCVLKEDNLEVEIVDQPKDAKGLENVKIFLRKIYLFFGKNLYRKIRLILDLRILLKLLKRVMRVNLKIGNLMS